MQTSNEEASEWRGSSGCAGIYTLTRRRRVQSSHTSSFVLLSAELALKLRVCNVSALHCGHRFPTTFCVAWPRWWHARKASPSEVWLHAARHTGFCRSDRKSVRLRATRSRSRLSWVIQNSAELDRELSMSLRVPENRWQHQAMFTICSFFFEKF